MQQEDICKELESADVVIKKRYELLFVKRAIIFIPFFLINVKSLYILQWSEKFNHRTFVW